MAVAQSPTVVVDGVELSGEWMNFLPFRVETDPFDDALLKETMTLPGGESIAKCWQCGTCSAGCTMNPYVDGFNPRQFIDLVRLGDWEEIKAKSDQIWRCASCQKCTHRCPKEVNTADVVGAITALLERRGVYAKPTNAEVFAEIFMDQVTSHGRIEEAKMGQEFYLKTGRAGELAKRAGMGMQMMLKGQMKLFGGAKVKHWKGMQEVLKRRRAAAGGAH